MRGNGGLPGAGSRRESTGIGFQAACFASADTLRMRYGLRAAPLSAAGCFPVMAGEQPAFGCGRQTALFCIFCLGCLPGAGLPETPGGRRMLFR